MSELAKPNPFLAHLNAAVDFISEALRAVQSAWAAGGPISQDAYQPLQELCLRTESIQGLVLQLRQATDLHAYQTSINAQLSAIRQFAPAADMATLAIAYFLGKGRSVPEAAYLADKLMAPLTQITPAQSQSDANGKGGDGPAVATTPPSPAFLRAGTMIKETAGKLASPYPADVISDALAEYIKSANSTS